MSDSCSACSLTGRPSALRGLEHALGLRQRERDALAEHVDRVDQSFGRQRRQHLVADEVDVVVAAPGVFGRQRVRAEEGRAHGDAMRVAEPARDAQLLALVSRASRP